MLWAWLSLFWVGFSDLYAFMVTGIGMIGGSYSRKYSLKC
jgi:hypothetical protein